MLQKFTKTALRCNGSKNHSNAASPKSLMSRGNILIFLVAMLLGVGVNSGFAQATSGSCGAGLTWQLTGTGNNLTLTISGTGAMDDYYSSAPWYSNRTSIRNIVIKDGVTRIGWSAFHGCSSLTSVTIPEGVTRIGNEAFYSCSSLTSITIPSSVTYIGWRAFSYCSSLASVTIPEGITYIETETFYNCSSLTSITIPESVTSIEKWAFADCSSLASINVESGNANYSSENGVLFDKDKTTLICCPAGKTGEYVIPSSVILIENSAFGGCSSLTSITIPSSVTHIENGAFHSCSSLTSITIPSSVTNIGAEAFYGCAKLQSITLSLVSSYSRLGELFLYSNTGKSTPETFVGYTHQAYDGGTHYYTPTSLKSINVTNDATIKNTFFNNCSNLTKISAPNATVENNAFTGCSSLDTLIISKPTGALGAPKALKYFSVTDKTLQSLPNGLLAGCESLTEVILPTFTTMGALFSTTANSNMQAVVQQNLTGQNTTFYMPKNLAKITITSASEIPFGAFYGCSMLKEITLGSTVRGLGEKAMSGCSGLEHIYSQWAYPPTAYNNSTFESVNKYACVVHVPANSKQYYASADGWKEFFTIQEEAPVKITVKSVPINGGIFNGITEYERNATATLEATGNSGYDFQGWMEGDAFVSANRIYSFTATANRTLYAIFTPRENENEVEITVQPTEAVIAWDGEVGASSYTLIVYSDAARTQEFARFEFDANGKLRAGGFSHRVTNLSAERQYHYTLTSLNNQGEKLSIAIGNFTTPLTSTNVGIETLPATSLRIYPNPTTGQLTISGVETQCIASLPQTVEIYNNAGRLVGANLCVRPDNSINISHLPNGVYILKIYTDKGVAISKIVKE